MKYQSSNTHCLKDISKVKDLKKSNSKVKVTNNDTFGKVLSQRIFMWNIKVLALTAQKIIERLTFPKKGSYSKVKG